MGYLFTVPQWFCGYDAFIELFFAVVTGLVAYNAGRVYTLTKSSASQLLSWSFWSFSISYIVLAVYNLFLLHDLNTPICQMMNIENVGMFSMYQIYLFAFFHLVGIIILLYMTLHMPSPRLLALLFALIFFGTIVSFTAMYPIFILSSLLLIFIVHYFIERYTQRKNKHSCIVMLGFIMLLLGNILFIFSLSMQGFYIIAHIIQLIAYLLILWNLISIRT